MNMIVAKKYDEDIDGNKMAYHATFYDHGLHRKACRSCTRYVILSITAFALIIMGISGVCFYFHRYVNVNVVSY